jgi:tetratricopeptide (TPR) repeat protein
LKQRHWLDLAEYTSIVGLGVGSLTSFFSTASAQFLYTSAPLSFLVLLNLANRKRMEQLSEQKNAIALAEVNHQLTQNITQLHRHMQALPTVETVSSLRRSLLTKNREVLEKLTSDLKELQQEMSSRLEPIEQQNLRSLRPEIRQLREQHAHLYDSVAQVSYRLQRVLNSSKMDNLEGAIAQVRQEIDQLQSQLQDLTLQTKPLQDQIQQVNRQFQKLPPPTDMGSLKQEMGELIRVIAELVPKRDMVMLVNEVRELHQQQQGLKQTIRAIESAAIGFKRQLSGLPPALTTPLYDSQHDSQLVSSSMAQLRSQLEHIPESIPESGATVVSASFYPEVQTMVTEYLAQLRSQLTEVQQITQTLAQHQRQLRAYVNQLPQTLDVVALQQQLQSLTHSVASIQSTQAFEAKIQKVLHRFHDVNQQLQLTAPQYELIFDLHDQAAGAASGSRAMLEAALERTQQRLILIYPWSGHYELDTALMQKVELFLKSNKQLEVGWCHQVDPRVERFLDPIDRGWADPQASQKILQDTLNQFLGLKRAYPDRLHFKILGTGETFLVSDQNFAVMGILDTLTSNTVLAEMHLKLRTTDANMVEQLIRRFEYPTLDLNDVSAHWNRAVTRYDLGDKAGAIADYTHVLALQPEDANPYSYRGLARYDLGDKAGAIADFDQSITLNPQQVAAYCNRGFIQAESGDLWGAITNYSLAIANQRDAAIAYFYRGMAYRKLEDFCSAEIDFSEAIRLAPNSAVAYYYRGITYQKLRNSGEAIADLEVATRLFVERGNKANAQKASKALKQSSSEAATSFSQAETGQLVSNTLRGCLKSIKYSGNAPKIGGL